jgi:hypothetical protein
MVSSGCVGLAGNRRWAAARARQGGDRQRPNAPTGPIHSTVPTARRSASRGRCCRRPRSGSGGFSETPPDGATRIHCRSWTVCRAGRCRNREQHPFPCRASSDVGRDEQAFRFRKSAPAWSHRPDPAARAAGPMTGRLGRPLRHPGAAAPDSKFAALRHGAPQRTLSSRAGPVLSTGLLQRPRRAGLVAGNRRRGATPRAVACARIVQASGRLARLARTCPTGAIAGANMDVSA